MNSHLPDITIITPVFDPNTKEIIFFTASRGHHADIGGILPGSMPPTSVNIFEEGAEIVSFKIVDGGIFDRKGLLEYMVEKPSQYPGCSGCRNIRDVESDLKAVSQLNLGCHPSWTFVCLANCGQSQGDPTNPRK
jgi:5-oxoprolinase (ATP-hydrolysing)